MLCAIFMAGIVMYVLCCIMFRVYRVFCDYVLKNPFYDADQVIKSELFDKNLVTVLQEYNARAVQ